MIRFVIVLGLVLAACSSGAMPPPSTVQDQAEPPMDLEPGTLDLRRATMSDGTAIEYGLILPAEFDSSSEYPVLLALPPGGQDIELAMSVASTTYLPEALARGWVVITPAAPGGTLFFQGSERYIDELLASLAWIRAEGERVHISGISNGGRSAFAVAALDPDRYESMVVFPGYPDSSDDSESLERFSEIPISMFVGGEDPGWIAPMTATRDALEYLGASVSLMIRGGEGHVMRSLSDGVDVFDFLDSQR
jgi:predicted peptidase